MKKVFFITALVVFGLTAVNAQDGNTVSFSKGSVFATGSVSSGSETVADQKMTQFTFNPSVGFFVSDNIAVGVALGLGSVKSEVGGGLNENTSTFSAGAFVSIISPLKINFLF